MPGRRGGGESSSSHHATTDEERRQRARNRLAASAAAALNLTDQLRKTGGDSDRKTADEGTIRGGRIGGSSPSPTTRPKKQSVAPPAAASPIRGGGGRRGRGAQAQADATRVDSAPSTEASEPVAHDESYGVDSNDAYDYDGDDNDDDDDRVGAYGKSTGDRRTPRSRGKGGAYFPARRGGRTGGERNAAGVDDDVVRQDRSYDCTDDDDSYSDETDQPSIEEEEELSPRRRLRNNHSLDTTEQDNTTADLEKSTMDQENTTVEEEERYDGGSIGNTPHVKRYKGFSTSVSSLFLDETLVCPAISCFGLILGQRTEHLLNERNTARGSTRRGRKIADHRPSHHMAVSLLFTVAFVATSYGICGFGEGVGMYKTGASETDGRSGYYEYNVAQDDDVAAGNAWDDDVTFDDYTAQAQEEDEDDGARDDDGAGENDEDDYFAGDDAAGNGDDYYAAEAVDDADGGNGDDYYNADDNADDNADGGNGDDYNNGDDGYNGDDGGRRRTVDQGSERSGAITGCIGSGNGRRMLGLSKLKEYHDHLWVPAYNMIKFEWSDEDRGGSGSTAVLPLVVGGRRPSQSSPRWRRLEHRQDVGRHLEEWAGDYYDEGEEWDGEAWGGAAWLRMLICLTFLTLLGIVGRRRRMRTRYAVLRARAEDDELYHAAHASRPREEATDEDTRGDTTVANDGFGTREDQFEGACSHTLCGCYPIDPLEGLLEGHTGGANDVNQYYGMTPGGTINSPPGDHAGKFGTSADGAARSLADGTLPKVLKQEDCVSHVFRCLLSTCCGYCCNVWVQCFSVCALAQEAREIRLLAPPRVQRIDWITHQPFQEYYKDIVELRDAWLNRKDRGKSALKRGQSCTATMRLHLDALSQLSRFIIATFVMLIITVVLTEKFNPRANFDRGDSIVMLITFSQSFVVIFFVHWIFHKADLSFDAVVKFFASGFVIGMPTAFIFEGIMSNIMLLVVYSLYGLFQYLFKDTFLIFFLTNYIIFWVLGELANAYVVAAFTEELCKYYAFRAVEHPDLIFLTGLDRRAHDPLSVYGGERSYVPSSHHVASFDELSTVGDSTYMSSSFADVTHYEEKSETRTLHQRAAAITTAMVSCYVGLACAENFIYVFFFGTIEDATAARGGVGGSNSLNELGMLVLRSVFPVHALTAAMQSIGVIQKFLEDPLTDDSCHIGIGKIVLPAVILHGTFDAILVLLNMYVETMWGRYYAHNGDDVVVPQGFVPYNALLLNTVAWSAIIMLMMAGLFWYYLQNRNQRARLKLIEEREERGAKKTMGEGNAGGDIFGPNSYTSPTVRLV